MELIDIIKKGSVADFKAAFKKLPVETQKEHLKQKLQNGMNVFHICCSQGYT